MVRYRLIAQNRNNYITAEIIGQNLYFTRPAKDIANDPILISQFPPEEAMIIGFIASESCYHCTL